jgi:hypothetical protein
LLTLARHGSRDGASGPWLGANPTLDVPRLCEGSATSFLGPGCTLRWSGVFCAPGLGCPHWVHCSVPSELIFVALGERSQGARRSVLRIPSGGADIAPVDAVGPTRQSSVDVPAGEVNTRETTHTHVLYLILEHADTGFPSAPRSAKGNAIVAYARASAIPTRPHLILARFQDARYPHAAPPHCSRAAARSRIAARSCAAAVLVPARRCSPRRSRRRPCARRRVRPRRLRHRAPRRV